MGRLGDSSIAFSMICQQIVSVRDVDIAEELSGWPSHGATRRATHRTDLTDRLADLSIGNVRRPAVLS